MRLQLRSFVLYCAAIALATISVSTPASADPEHPWRLGADMLVSTDTDNVVVFSPQLSVHRELGEDGAEARARVAVDIVSAASVDVVSQATRRFSETREEASLGATLELGNLRPSLDYRFSIEPDYVAHGVHARLLSELGSSDTVLSVGYGVDHDTIGLRGTPFDVWSQALWNHRADASLTQVLGENTLVRGVYTLSVQDGYLAKPYRYVPLFDARGIERANADGARIDLSNFDRYRLPARVPEAVPDLRVGHAFALRALRYVEPLEGAVRLDYQLYVDSWGVVAHMVEGALALELSQAFLLVPHARVYVQSSASFWKREYQVDAAEVIPRLRTLDRELSTYQTATVGVRLEWKSEWLDLYAEATASYSHFDDFVFLEDRTSLVSLVGARWRP